MKKIDYLDPIVDEWDDDARTNEMHEKIVCDWLLFVIMLRIEGVYSIAEVVDLSNKAPQKTIFCILDGIMVQYSHLPAENLLLRLKGLSAKTEQRYAAALMRVLTF